MAFDTWYIIISGFRQNKSSWTNGCISIFQEVETKCDGRVELLAWNDDMEQMAKFISLISPTTPNILVFAYSWGCGHGFIELAKHLSPLKIQEAVLCDPVYYSFLYWRAFLWHKIRIPNNVEKIWQLRQEHDWPRGHDLVGKGRIFSPIILNLPHVEMDNSREFKDLCLNIAKSYS